MLFARHRPGPLGVGVYLVDATRPGFDATGLSTLGLRGVELSEIHLHDVVVEPQDVLGRHLSPTRRGLLGAVRTFTRLRPVVGALGLGWPRPPTTTSPTTGARCASTSERASTGSPTGSTPPAR
ncbi:hypothetical protein NKG05_14635 [Oerskovia sp. M15]